MTHHIFHLLLISPCHLKPSILHPNYISKSPQTKTFHHISHNFNIKSLLLMSQHASLLSHHIIFNLPTPYHLPINTSNVSISFHHLINTNTYHPLNLLYPTIIHHPSILQLFWSKTYIKERIPLRDFN